MNKKIVAIIATVLICNSITPVIANASSITNDVSNEITVNDKSEKTRTFVVQADDDFNRAGDLVTLTLRNDGSLLTCYNRRTGVTYSCNPYSSYVGYGYTNGKGEVGCIQGLLNYLGAGLVVDGLFGPKTYDAILRFQRGLSGHLTVDGIAGPKTFDWAIYYVFEDGPIEIRE